MSYKRVALAYGSNLGDRNKNIELAISKLRESGLKNIVSSSYVKSDPVDCPEGSGEFFNGALVGEWAGSCRQLMMKCQKIEIEMGRKRIREVNAPRPIDLDILLFEEELHDDPDLKVPHPRMLKRDFVMEPLREVAADWILPELNCTVGQYLEGLV